MAADRVARRREKAAEILAFNASERHRVPQTGGHYETALAYRARLSGAQARVGTRTLRRARLAGLPPPRHLMHRGLRIPCLREGDDSPLRTSFHPFVQEICRSRRSPAPRLCR